MNTRNMLMLFNVLWWIGWISVAIFIILCLHAARHYSSLHSECFAHTWDNKFNICLPLCLGQSKIVCTCHWAAQNEPQVLSSSSCSPTVDIYYLVSTKQCGKLVYNWHAGYHKQNAACTHYHASLSTHHEQCETLTTLGMRSYSSVMSVVNPQ